MWNINNIVTRGNRYMLKPYTRNRRIYDYLESSFEDNTIECNILRRILKCSLWEVVLDKRDSSSVLYKDILLTGKVRLVACTYRNGTTRLEVFSALGNGIGNYYRGLRDYYDCLSPTGKRLIMIDTDMSYERVIRIINGVEWKHLLFHV